MVLTQDTDRLSRDFVQLVAILHTLQKVDVPVEYLPQTGHSPTLLKAVISALADLQDAKLR
jgi:hypothetical protein